LTVDGCHPNRSTEIADLAVDVAITAIQLLVPSGLRPDGADHRADGPPLAREI